jgi:hypothetical protein
MDKRERDRDITNKKRRKNNSITEYVLVAGVEAIAAMSVHHPFLPLSRIDDSPIPCHELAPPVLPAAHPRPFVPIR